ncbi:hypothetical protein BDZ45DRAFT_699001 [Acephala macrosclerotiorum]|nr:hypothetical protein BDZ45DRAFT_699001 [Acephala macrosclerotiorum]
MSHQALKISPTKRPNGASPISYGDLIYWHYASFVDLKTEKSKMVTSSLLTQYGEGRAGHGHFAQDPAHALLLNEIYRVECFLGEKSKDLKRLFVFWHNGQMNEESKRIKDVDTRVKDFKTKVLRESADLNEPSNLDAQFECQEFTCALFKDFWLGEYPVLLEYTSKDLERVLIRRGCTQGSWALALRRLGSVLRETEGG